MREVRRHVDRRYSMQRVADDAYHRDMREWLLRSKSPVSFGRNTQHTGDGFVQQ